jgi:glucose 1-dehydrogenase
MMEASLPLSGQVALVTGGSSGIGKACAVAMAEAGATVVVNHRPPSRDKAEEVVDRIRANGGRAIAIGADVSDEDQVREMFAQAIEAEGTVHILVNNAGIQRDADFLDMTLENWRLVLDVNLTGQFICAKEAVREFLRRGIDKTVSKAAGKIICMSSVHQVIPWAHHVNYAASKGGVHLFMESLAQEMAPHKIRINAIAPGAIRTGINRSSWKSREAREKLLELIPYGRIGETEDVAKVAVWLASDDSDYVMGATIVVGGGMLLYPGFAGNG